MPPTSWSNLLLNKRCENAILYRLHYSVQLGILITRANPNSLSNQAAYSILTRATLTVWIVNATCFDRLDSLRVRHCFFWLCVLRNNGFC